MAELTLAVCSDFVLMQKLQALSYAPQRIEGNHRKVLWCKAINM